MDTEQAYERKRDAELVRRAKLGDPAARTAIIAAYKDVTWNLVRRRTCSHDNASEIVQDVFLKVLRGLPQYVDTESFRAWLIRIALNCIVDFQRYQRTRRHDSLECIDVDCVASHAKNPMAEVETRELCDLLARELSHLSERYRTIIVLRIYEGQSFRVIAETVGTTEDTAKHAFHRAIEKLRNRMDAGDTGYESNPPSAV